MRINTTYVKLLLAQQGMTQAELASRCGISRQSVSTILQRRTCSPVNVGRLAAGLGVNPADIIIERS